MPTIDHSMVREFIKNFEASLDPRLWFKLIKEELAELEEALLEGDKEHILKEAADLMYVVHGFEVVCPKDMLLLITGEEANTLGTLQVKIEKALEEAEKIFTHEQLQEAFRRVHISNMSKLGEDGRPIRREDGKVLKGPNYLPPDLKDMVDEN